MRFLHKEIEVFGGSIKLGFKNCSFRGGLSDL